MMNEKKTYYKITDGDTSWTCSEEDLKLEIIAWLSETDKLVIEPVQMTKAEFDELPEFEG